MSDTSRPTQRTIDQPAENVPFMAAVIREFTIEILGSLIPGFLFTMVAIPLIVWTGLVILQSKTTYQVTLLPQVTLYRIEIIPLLLVVSYVLGSVFSRRDPKGPDQESVAYILRKDWRSLHRSTVQALTAEDKKEESELESESSSGNALTRFQVDLRIRRFAHKLAQQEGGQYPYSHLYEYLMARGLGHIAKIVPWRGSGGLDKRSKMFINVLKIRLQHWNPRQCGEIVRNEAHIRMMSSVWYAARLLQQVSLVLVVAAAVMCKWRDPSLGEIAFVVFALFLAVEWLRRAITSFLHYQRVREIVYVLESAHIAWRAGYNHIFEGF